jgi:hypothetical protein
MSCLPSATNPSEPSSTPRWRHLSSYAVAALALTALLAGCGRLNEKPPQVVDLSGTWQLSRSLSDDPSTLLKPPHRHRKHRDTRPEDAEGAPAGSRPDGDDGGQRSGGGREDSSFARDRTRGTGTDFAMLRNLLAQPAELSIQQLPRELRLTADGSPTRYVYGQDALDSVQGGVAERTAGWNGSVFVIRYDVRQGPEAIRSYQTDATGQRLTVTTRVSGGGGPKLEIRTIYERKSPG